ncbi:hypothetical protein T484DRAFT_2491199 [Baffinella frigidus]|nr:hypothetical protein T484DRAFT_2491199 [Cryptophyta sp. CCMP2293]
MMALDESCGHAFVSLGKGVGYTAYLHVNYKVPIPAGIPVLITVKPSKIEGRKVYLAASLSDGSSQTARRCSCSRAMTQPSRAPPSRAKSAHRGLEKVSV